MATATFLSAEHNPQDETTIYWFEFTGADGDIGIDLDGKTYGIVDTGGMPSVLNGAGYPIPAWHREAIAVRDATDGARSPGFGSH